MEFAHFEPRKDADLDKSRYCTYRESPLIVLSLKKFLISVLWDLVVLILRDLIHSTDYSMVLGKWGPVTI